MVAETLGGLSEDAVGIIGSLAAATSQRTDGSDPSSSNHLFQRVAVALWSGEAMLAYGYRGNHHWTPPLMVYCDYLDLLYYFNVYCLTFVLCNYNAPPLQRCNT